MSNNNADLKKKTIDGFFWSFIDNVGTNGAQFIIGIILARLLAPSDFGLIGMLYIFIAIGQFLMNSGLSQALIRNNDSNNVDFSTIFYFNIFVSIVIWLIICFLAPIIADFYKVPQLESLSKVLCFSFVIGSFGLIQQTYLSKSVDFKTQSLIGVISVLISGVIGIYLAYSGYGVWALVVQTLLRSFFTVALLWRVSKWRPLFMFKFSSLKKYLGFGTNILVGGLIGTVFDNLYLLVIGRLFSAQSLGFYTRAVQLRDLPIISINSIIQKVTYSVFSKIQDNNELLIKGFQRVSRLLVFITLPVMCLLIVLAKPLIHLVLTDKWMPSVIYLQMLCAFGWIYVLQTINILVITVKGRSDYYLKLQFFEKSLIILNILITYRYGISAIIIGQMTTTILSYFLSTYFLRKTINYKLIQQAKDVLPFILAAILMFIILIPITSNISNSVINILTCSFVGLFLYFFFLWTFHTEEINEGIRYLVKIKIRIFNFKVKT